MKACILVKTVGGRFTSIANEVAGVSGIKTSFSVMGRADVVAIVDAPDLKGLSSIALKIGQIDGVAATETLIALEGA